MAAGLILETTFLIDLERELIRCDPGAAHAFLRNHPAQLLFITYTIAGELAAGPSLEHRDRWEEFITPFRILSMNRTVSWEYGRAYRYLRENGLLIGANDLWIAATALAYRLPVVTRNERHYRRVPHLTVLGYLESA